jgi:hypothetical protein
VADRRAAADPAHHLAARRPALNPARPAVEYHAATLGSRSVPSSPTSQQSQRLAHARLIVEALSLNLLLIARPAQALRIARCSVAASATPC